uniref:Uncharacterized protein n=1 Tax=Caenorhabditis tropicalis TaxID=1561998 RepID=A0A1I7TUB5_9PELO
MAPTDPSNDNHACKNSILGSLNSAEQPLAEDDLLFYYYFSQFQSPKKTEVLSEEEELDRLIEVGNTGKTNYQQGETPAKQENRHNIFMYNLFRRKGSQERASTYLRKLESAKNEKIKKRISKICKNDSDAVTLSAEKINPDDARRRRVLEKNAKAATVADRLNAQRIMNSVLRI